MVKFFLNCLKVPKKVKPLLEHLKKKSRLGLDLRLIVCVRKFKITIEVTFQSPKSKFYNKKEDALLDLAQVVNLLLFRKIQNRATKPLNIMFTNNKNKEENSSKKCSGHLDQVSQFDLQISLLTQIDRGIASLIDILLFIKIRLTNAVADLRFAEPLIDAK
ncbi:hypothetical protein BpHYR1_026214 [Brachionus plicatilis]|uniref:Uncharacterized protein n=1 Tax=Brachionus plicatilis TaxID=10195 RepID=A0A3M7QV93_BRAPC|nr:hypothetical protein BpHYR1_026214 [Brachionus plicatilis]